MREIKFKAWDKKQKRMFKVDAIMFWRKQVDEYRESAGEDIFHDFEDIVLLQFTGLHDTADQDILENEAGCRVLVEWDNRTLAWNAKFLNPKDRPSGNIESISLFLWYNFSHKKVRIIGNSFENPEPLEKPKEESSAKKD